MNGRFRLCAAVVLGTVWLAGPPGTPAEPPQPEASEAWFKNHALAEGALQRILSNGAFWTKRAHKEELLACLRAARTLRSAALAPVLADHIDYIPVYDWKTEISKEARPGSEEWNRQFKLWGEEYARWAGAGRPLGPPFEERYPAAAALIAISMPAVPAILDQMRHLDLPPLPEKKPSEGVSSEYVTAVAKRRPVQYRASLLVRCLVGIYDAGGHGTGMAKHRVQLEAEKATGKEKENLLRFLEEDSGLLRWNTWQHKYTLPVER